MVESDQSAPIALPEELQGQFRALESRLFKVETFTGIAGCVAGVAGSYLLVFASDRIWDSPGWLRGAAFVGGAVVVGVFASKWLKRWVLRRRTQKDLATIVQRRFGRLGDRLLGIVELSSEEKHLHGFSPELYRAAIRQVANESAQYKFAEAVPHGPLAQALRGAVIGGGLALVSLVVFPKAGLNAAQRAAAPWANIPRFTLVQMAGVPSELLVPHGEEFRLQGQVRYESFWKPSRVAAWFGRTPSANADVQNATFTLAIPGQLEEGNLRVRIGDAETTVRVRPLLRPSLKNLDANITLPDYLKLPAREQNAQGGSLTVVEGSKASFRGQVSRNLAQAEALASGETLALKTETNQFTTASILLDNVSSAEFSWKDQFGFTNQSAWKLAIQTQKDAAPVPEIPELSREVSILESEVVQIKVRGRDDFGVRKLGLVFDLGNSTITNQPADFSAEAETSDRVDLDKTFTFTPLLLQAAPDTTIALKGQAVDFFPGREPSETPSYRIHILGNEQHAEMVRQRLESVMARLEEVSRLEEKIAAATAELKANEKVSDDELARKASELKDEQTQNAEALKDMAEEGMKNLREALKNPAFSEEVLKEWSKTLNEMKKLASKEMPKAAKALEEAGKKPKDKDEKLAEAEEAEKEVLQDLEQMQKRINKGLDDLQALTLAQRLRKMGTNQKEIQTELEKAVADTIGMRPDELSARHRKANGFLAEQQVDASVRSKDLQGEISRFFERTHKPNYGMVSKQMAEARTPEELDRIRTLIEGNISMQAMDTLSLWSGRFDAWADLLEPKKDDGGGSGSSGPGGEPPEEDDGLKQLMALLRLREGQLNLRERTRMLDKDRRDETFYKESAKKLHAAESKLVETLDAVSAENSMTEMEASLRESSRALQSVETLLSKPQTDEVATVAHNKALEKLSDAINLLNEQQQKKKNDSKPGEGQGEEMAFLMQMMEQQGMQPGMQGGMKPGMNMNGGDTTQAATPVVGGANNGRNGPPRVGKKSGGSAANAPSEFRDALDSYYKALEKGPQ